MATDRTENGLLTPNDDAPLLTSGHYQHKCVQYDNELHLVVNAISYVT